MTGLGPRPVAATARDAALAYAAVGLAVMPLHTPGPAGCSCREGRDCSSAGKHPRVRHGLRDASTDPVVIAAWWRRWPDANVGVVTGGLLDVCDADTGSGLAAVLDVLDVIRPAGPVVRTGAGWHLWFAATGLRSRSSFLPGVDWRGDGGSVVAPPSVHATGARYYFQQPWTPGQQLPVCPPMLRRLLVPRVMPVTVPARTGEDRVGDLARYVAAALEGEVARVLAAPRPVFRAGVRIAAGGRNAALNLAAFRLGQLSGRGGLDAATAWPRLARAATAAGLPAREARRTIASGWNAGLRHPRH